MGTLYIVATPIGNLEDITLRAIRILKEADIILCEDTRQSQKLLAHLGIHKQLVSYHQHSGFQREDEIIQYLKEGKTLALVSDGGTPAISDPGGKLVSLVREKLGTDVQIVPIPGPSAVTAAASAAGMPVSDFLFLGFIPHKKGRNKLFDEIAQSKRSVIFYESPHRIQKSIKQLAERLCPERKVVICREITKKFETITAGTIKEVAQKVQNEKPRGEYVVVVNGA